MAFDSILDDTTLEALPPVPRDHALYLEDARLRSDAFGVIVWAAVLLEALLTDALPPEQKKNKDRPDLNGLIDNIGALLKNAGNAAPEVIDSSHAVRANRNRAVHDTGLAKRALDDDARQSLARLRVVLDWWRARHPVQPAAAPDWLGRVFLATITPDQARHRGFLIDLRAELVTRRLQPVVVELSDYDRKTPLKPVAEAMRTCDAVLVVGLERSRAFYVRDREGSAKQAEETNRRYSSAWLHMESALAYGVGLGDRVFVLCEPTIHSEGVFDKDWNQFQRVEIENLSIDDANVRETLDRLAAAVAGRLKP
jgi:hypothetical protein